MDGFTVVISEEAGRAEGVRLLLPPAPVVAVEPLPAAPLHLVELNEQMEPENKQHRVSCQAVFIQSFGTPNRKTNMSLITAQSQITWPDHSFFFFAFSRPRPQITPLTGQKILLQEATRSLSSRTSSTHAGHTRGGESERLFSPAWETTTTRRPERMENMRQDRSRPSTTYRKTKKNQQ